MPKEWHTLLKQAIDTNLEEMEGYKIIDELDDSKNPTKLIYNHLIKKKFLPPTKQIEKWNLELQSEGNYSEHLNNLERACTATINNKLHSFNCNVFIRNIPYNTRLHKMNIKDNPLCEKCQEKEDILHLYWECPNTQRLWEQLKNMLGEAGIQLEHWSPHLCLFGFNLQERDNQIKS